MRKLNSFLVLFLVVTFSRASIRAQEQYNYDRQALRGLLPELSRAAQASAASSAISSNPFDKTDDEDHTNVELDKIAGAHRYELLPENGSNDSKLADLLVKASPSTSAWRPTGPYLVEVVREGSRQLRSAPQEDKEYRFVSVPAYFYPPRLSGRQQTKVDKLRDMIMSNAQSYRKLSRFSLSAEDEAGANNHYIMKADNQRPSQLPVSAKRKCVREKRRRCKVDPNLGIKNPSFCDTDAYFGAADYGMRNMWDSAGR